MRRRRVLGEARPSQARQRGEGAIFFRVVKVQVRSTSGGNNFSLAKDIANELYYLSHFARFPLISTYIVYFMLQSYSYQGNIYNNTEALKKSSLILLQVFLTNSNYLIFIFSTLLKIP